MTTRRRTNPDELGGPAQAYGGIRDAQLGREAGAVLAVLVLASYWPGRFADGWVTDNDIGSNSRDLPYPKAGDVTRRETLKALIRRGLRQLANALPPSAIERRPVGGVPGKQDPRERTTRLALPLLPELEHWFAHFGLDRLDHETRNAFREQSYGAVGSMGDFLNALDEGTLHRLLHNANAMIGRVAQQIASNALSRATTKQDRRVFALALAEAERACLQFTRCLQRLRELAADPGPFRSPAEYLLQARILMVLADTHTNVMIGDALDVEEARSCIDRARQLIPFGDHLDRSDLLLVEAKLDEMEARTLQYGGGSSEDILRFRARAEFAILSAMNTYRLIKRWDRIDDALTELSFVPGGLKLQSVDNARGRLLIPWLYGVVRFRDEAYGRDWHGTPTNVSGTYRLHNLILEAFHTLPLDILASELPLPAQDCYQLLQRALLDFRNEEFDNSPELDPEERELPIEQAEWFLVQRAEEKARRGY